MNEKYLKYLIARIETTEHRIESLKTSHGKQLISNENYTQKMIQLQMKKDTLISCLMAYHELHEKSE